MEQVNWAILQEPIKLIIAIYFNKTNAMPVELFQPTSLFFFFFETAKKT